MNVDEAMEAAAEFKVEMKVRPAWTLFSEKVAVVLSFEVERLRAELRQLRKDWCDDDEAIKQQALRVLDAAKVEGDSVYVPSMGALAEMMSNEMVKLRAELARCQSLLDEARTELSICGAFHAVAKKEWQLEVERVNRLEVELAAAKADKTPPTT